MFSTLWRCGALLPILCAMLAMALAPAQERRPTTRPAPTISTAPVVPAELEGDNIVLTVELASGTEFTVTEVDPAFTAGKLVIDVDRTPYDTALVTIWNTGAPWDYGNDPWTPEPAFLRCVTITMPAGWKPVLAPYNGAREVEPGVWSLISPEDVPPVHPGYPQSVYYHCLDGGDTALWEVALNGASLPLPTPEQRWRAQELLELDPEIVGHPAMQRVLSLYTVRRTSFQTHPPLKDFGWHFQPANIAAHYTSRSLADLSGWYHFGDVVGYSEAESHTNCHYGHDQHFLTYYLLTGDPAAFYVGLNLVRYKIAFGLIRTPDTSSWTRGWWRGEKGIRRGVGQGVPKPTTNKEWDAGLCLASILAPDDAFIAEGMATRKTCLLTRDHGLVWNGGGGGRGIGHALESLWDHWRTTGDDAFQARAAGVMDHVFKRLKALGDTPYFVNIIAPTIEGTKWISGAEEALAHAAIWKWTTVGVGTQHVPKLRKMVTWLIESAGEWRNGVYTVSYQVSIDGTRRKVDVARQGIMWSRIWTAAKDLGLDGYGAAEASCWVGIWADIPLDIQLGRGAWGPAVEKWSGIIASAVRR